MNKHLFSTETSPTEEIGFEPHETANRYIATHLGVDPEAEKQLQERIDSNNQLQNNLAERYLEAAKKERSIRQNALFIINGWNEHHQQEHNTESIARLLLRKSSHHSCGLYLRWNGAGIVVNPGWCFLKNFHRQGFHIKDISHVIVTKNTPEHHGDIQRIYNLNHQLNKLNPELHIIHYYLSQPTYQDLAHSLKPNFKQERNTVHNLELFLDSPDVEQEHLADGIILNYFCTNAKDGTKFSQSDCLGIRFDLSSNRNDAVKLAYVSGGPWSPLLSHHTGPCDILLAGFGRTNTNDFGKLNYNDDCLGYFGSYTLLEEVKPKLLLCGEFDGWDGDIRLEAIKKLRKESGEHNKGSSIVLPYDNGLVVDLNQLLVECSISRSLLQAQEVRVMKTHDAFGSLKYLSQKCLM